MERGEEGVSQGEEGTVCKHRDLNKKHPAWKVRVNFLGSRNLTPCPNKTQLGWNWLP